jgi:hypothetical protein
MFAIHKVGAMSPRPLRIRCREIAAPDLDQIADLLRRGFPNRTREFWKRALDQLSEHATTPGLPRYGHLLECDGAPVGVRLMIFSTIEVNGEPTIRCNVSSWYVEPAYRIYGAVLGSRSEDHKHVTYFNITPSEHTLPILEAQGYVRYCNGRLLITPAVIKNEWVSRIIRVTRTTFVDMDLTSFENDLLLKHVDYGCISVICNLRGRSYPFVFLPLRKAGIVPYAYLAYCRQLEEFVRFAGSLGRFLARYGCLLVVVDSNGPVKGLVGAYFDGAPKYFKGPNQPHLGDMAYSERVMFGF